MINLSPSVMGTKPKAEAKAQIKPDCTELFSIFDFKTVTETELCHLLKLKGLINLRRVSVEKEMDNEKVE